MPAHIFIGEIQEFEQSIRENRDRIGNIESAIESLKAIYGPSVTESSPRLEVPPETFDAMTLADAAEFYLGVKGSPEHTAPLWEALSAGGAKTTSKNPVNNLGTTLAARPDRFSKGRGSGIELPETM